MSVTVLVLPCVYQNMSVSITVTVLVLPSVYQNMSFTVSVTQF